MELINFLKFLILVFEGKGPTTPELEIKTDKLLAQTEDRFLSVALDSSLIAQRWKSMDFHSPKVLAMGKALSPGYLRIGGTAADLLIFDGEIKEPRPQFDETKAYCAQCGYENLDELYKKGNFTMTKNDWDEINSFASKTGLKILFDVNVLLRKGPNLRDWDNTNARKLIEYSISKGYTNIDWELGNEPNSLKHQLNFTLTGTQLGQSFIDLRKLLNTFEEFKNSRLVGPDLNAVRWCNPKNPDSCKAAHYFRDVFEASKGVIEAATWHHYNLDGHTATLADFLKIGTLNNLQSQINAVKEFTKMSKYSATKPVWLGETASAYGGGARGISDRYVAGFLWLDKLGVAAANGYGVVIRQTFYHGCYALIDENLDPNPDFWISALFKKLVSDKVLKLDVNHASDARQRFYAHCSKQFNGALVVYGINMSPRSATFKLAGDMLIAYAGMVDRYIISTTEAMLQSKMLYLNGHLLQLNDDGSLPEFMPKKMKSGGSITLDRFEMGFWVLNDANLDVCTL